MTGNTSPRFDTVRAKNYSDLATEIREWLEETDVAAIEDVTVHRDASGRTVYSIFYWEGHPEDVRRHPQTDVHAEINERLEQTGH